MDNAEQEKCSAVAAAIFTKVQRWGIFREAGEVTRVMLGGSTLYVNANRGETTLDSRFQRLPNERMLRWTGNE